MNRTYLLLMVVALSIAVFRQSPVAVPGNTAEYKPPPLIVEETVAATVNPPFFVVLPVGISAASIYTDSSQKHVAYVATEAGKQRVVVNGKRHRTYESIESAWVSGDKAQRLFFSPDGSRLAYTGKRDGAYYLVVDGVEVERLYRPVTPFFSSKNLLAFARSNIDIKPGLPDDHAPDSNNESRMMSVVVEESVGKLPQNRPTAYMTCTEPLFSPDGKRVVYFAWDEDDNLRLVETGYRAQGQRKSQI